MAQEIGVAYVTVAPSAKGFGKAVEGEIDQGVDGATKKSGGRLKSLAGNVLKWGGAAVLGVGAAITGIALKGGIDRALNIEDAQAKLKGLGHDTQSIDAIMTDALASVKGTAFGLDAAATTAASAVASGIKPGQELERYLKLTADAATIAGVSMDEMGSIMNKVQAKGIVQTEDLNRLTERGIPIMQMLADEYGVSAQEMSKMVSNGEVDAERFRKALESNVGGAALESGNTTRGAFENMKASLSRLGLAFVGDGLSGAKSFFNEMTVIFDGLGERIGPWVEKIQEKLGKMFQIEGMGENFLDWLDDVLTTVANGPIPQLLNALAPLLPALAEVAELVGPALGEAFMQLADALLPVIPELVDKLVPAFIELAPLIADLLVELVPLLPTLVDLAVEVLPPLVDILELLVPLVADMAITTLEAVTSFVGLFDVLSGDTSLEEWNATLAESPGWYGRFAKSVQDAGLAIGFSLAETKLGFNTVKDHIARTLGSMALDVQAKWNEVAGAFALGVTRAVVWVITLPARIRAAVANAGAWLYQTGRDILQGLIDGINSMIERVLGAIRNVGDLLPESIKSVLGIASPSRVFRDEVGKMIGLGLVAGIEDTAIRSRVDTAVSHLVQIPDTEFGGGGAGVTQNNTIYLQDRDERLMIRRLGRALQGVVIA